MSQRVTDERLTKRIDGEVYENHDNDVTPEMIKRNPSIERWRNGSRACMEKLAAYEDAMPLSEAQELGRYAIGTKIYDVIWDCHEWEVQRIEIFDDKILLRCGNEGTENYAAFYTNECGTRFAMTREEAAEAALREKGVGGDE